MENQMQVSNQVDVYSNAAMFDQIQRAAKVFSESDMVPTTYKGKIGNCVIALEMAYRMKQSPLIIMQNLNIIHGRPGWSSKYIIAGINNSGKFSHLTYEEDEKNGGRCRAVAVDLATNKPLIGTWVTMEMAKAEKWIDKTGSKWQTMPEQMIKYRAASFWSSLYAPELTMGLPTTEEIEDIIPITDSTVVSSAPLNNGTARVQLTPEHHLWVKSVEHYKKATDKEEAIKFILSRYDLTDVNQQLLIEQASK